MTYPILAIIAVGTLGLLPISAAGDPAATVKAVLKLACGDAPQPTERLAEAIDGIDLVGEQTIDIGGAPGRRRATFSLVGGDRLIVDRLFPGGQFRRLTVEHHEQTAEGFRPVLQAVANAACDTIDARRLRYGPDGGASVLAHLGPDLSTVVFEEQLNPPVPEGRDPGGVTVALFDSGVNYTLPAVADRLARDADGDFLGYDFWDGDDRPYDANTRATPFFPLHHGTAVASVLLREAPEVRLLPFRYPDPDMTRMGDMVAAADRAGARVVAMPMGSNRETDWTTFVEAAAARPHMLFILSAGNDGRDIDREPVYPAAIGLDNALVVTSATPFGKLAEGSNRGVASVDLMVPAEKLDVIDHRGAAGKASGSSYAVPRVAALAARLLAAHPDWSAADLKAAILARASPSPYQRTRVTRSGWIANPADGP